MKSRGSPPNEGVRKHVGHNKDTNEEVVDRIHMGEGPQEREANDRVESVASACRSLGRSPPVLGMVARRGVPHCLPRGLLVGSRVAPGRVARSVSYLAPLHRGPPTVLGSLPSPPDVRSENTRAEECLPFWQSGSGDGVTKPPYTLKDLHG